MSVPPYQPPQGSYYPPPPPKSSGSGCLKAAGIGCGILLLLAIIGGIAAVNIAKKSGVFNASMQMGQAGMDGVLIQQAVVKYHTKNGRYPNSLTDLTADGEITDSGVLHNGMDANPNPSHMSWAYTKPAEGAPGDTPILQENFTIRMPTMPNVPTNVAAPQMTMIINLDGTTRTMTNTTMPSMPTPPSSTQ